MWLNMPAHGKPFVSRSLPGPLWNRALIALYPPRPSLRAGREQNATRQDNCHSLDIQLSFGCHSIAKSRTPCSLLSALRSVLSALRSQPSGHGIYLNFSDFIKETG